MRKWTKEPGDTQEREFNDEGCTLRGERSERSCHIREEGRRVVVEAGELLGSVERFERASAIDELQRRFCKSVGQLFALPSIHSESKSEIMRNGRTEESDSCRSQQNAQVGNRECIELHPHDHRE